jgi:hypothetical protein
VIDPPSHGGGVLSKLEPPLDGPSSFCCCFSGDRLRLPLPAPAEQIIYCAERDVARRIAFGELLRKRLC